MRRTVLNVLASTAALLMALLAAEGLTRYLRDEVRFDLMAQRDLTTDVVDGVELWRERNPRATADDIRRAAADPEAFTVIGLGDSIMFGSGVAPEQTYLEEARRVLTGRTSRPIEVLNLAVPGYNTRQENAVYGEIEGRIQPDLVIVHYWDNDVHQYRFVGGYVVNAGDISADGHLVLRTLPLPPRINDFLLMHSRLYALLSRAIVAYQYQTLEPDWSVVAEPLAQIDERARRAGGRLLILASAQLNQQVAQPSFHLARLRELAAARGIELIDVSAWLQGIDVARIALDGCHFNPEGHRIIGARLAEHLLAHDLKAAR